MATSPRTAVRLGELGKTRQMRESEAKPHSPEMACRRAIPPQVDCGPVRQGRRDFFALSLYSPFPLLVNENDTPGVDGFSNSS
jgi:hypothetical protein